jgi:hypothetical protein
MASGQQGVAPTAVMAELVPAIDVLLATTPPIRVCPGSADGTLHAEGDKDLKRERL